MKGIKTIAYIAAGILILFGVLFIVGSGGETGGGWSWVFIGLVLVVIAFAIILFASRRAAKEAENVTNVNLNIDLPGGVSMSTIKCKSCGGELHAEDIEMVAGAPVVSCPYCHTTYQITEEPKW